jgi:hypothetical protein
MIFSIEPKSYTHDAFLSRRLSWSPTASFFSLKQEDSRKVIDPEGRVSEPLECGHDWMLWGTLFGIKDQGSLRAWDSSLRSLKGGRSKSSPTRPSVSWSMG